jgi:hypothetical protein
MADLNYDIGAILADPDRITELPAEAIPFVLARLTALQSQLTTQLLLTTGRPAEAPQAAEEWIDIAEASQVIHKSTKWFYRHARTLPFVRRLGPKSLLVSKPAMMRWLERQKA